MSKNKQKILITGGHLTPALATLDELQKRGYSNFIWVGHRYNQHATKSDSKEYEIINELGIPFLNLKTGKLVRSVDKSNLQYALTQFLLLFVGFFQALVIILKNRPKLILTFGGFLAVPIVFWAWVFRIKIITHEQTIVAGLANRIISKFANKVLISWESSKKFFKSKKVVLTGNPIRKEILKQLNVTSKENNNSKLPMIFVTGGNQGANIINQKIFDSLENLLEKCIVVHQTGNSTVTNDFSKARQHFAKLSKEKQNRYFFRDYFKSQEMAELLATSDLIVSRAGANTVSEILILGKLALLIPIPWVSHNEQYLNAKVVADSGLGYIIEQNKAFTTEKLYQSILLGLNHKKENVGFNGKKLNEIQKATRDSIKLNAHKLIADEVESLIN